MVGASVHEWNAVVVTASAVLITKGWSFTVLLSFGCDTPPAGTSKCKVGFYVADYRSSTKKTRPCKQL